MTPPTESPTFAPKRALLHPLWLASLGLLVLNDHVLKGSGLLPGVVTGKLSDLAGMIVAPALLATLLGVRDRRGLLACHVAVGVGFGVLEVSPPLAAALDAAARLVGLRWRSWADPTDLFALPFLAVSYAFFAPVMERAAARPRALRGFAQMTAATVGLLACVATTAEPEPACISLDCDDDGHLVVDDCNDADPAIHPGAVDDSVDGRDQDCDGRDGPMETDCDDGVDDDGDGAIDCDDFPDCAAACVAQNAPCNYKASAVVGINEGTTTVLVAGDPSAVQGACVGADGGEASFLFRTPSVPLGVLSLSVSGATPHGVHVRLDCNDAGSEMACAAPPAGGGSPASLQVLVPGDTDLTIVVEAAAAGAEGPFTLSLGYSPLVCGDGVVTPPETCDDANLIDGDGCSATCEVEP